jgi:hypothetical protein
MILESPDSRRANVDWIMGHRRVTAWGGWIEPIVYNYLGIPALHLYDDEKHEDNQPNDGIWANALPDNPEGYYVQDSDGYRVNL